MKKLLSPKLPFRKGFYALFNVRHIPPFYDFRVRITSDECGVFRLHPLYYTIRSGVVHQAEITDDVKKNNGHACTKTEGKGRDIVSEPPERGQKHF